MDATAETRPIDTRPFYQRPGPRWLLVLALLCGIAIAYNVATEGKKLRYDKGEIHIYFLAAERMMQGEEISRKEDRKPYTYPPGMVLPFVPMTLLPELARRPVWYACNILLLVFVVRMLLQVLAAGGWPQGSKARRRWFWFCVILLSGRHLFSVFENQSHDLLVFAVVMLGVRASCRSRETMAGLGPGIGASLKATPLLFLPVYVLQRRFWAASSVVAGAALFLFAPDVLFPRQAGGLWIQGWLDEFVFKVEAVGGTTDKVGNAWDAWNILNQNLGGSIYRLFTEITEPTSNKWDIALLHLDRSLLKAFTAATQLGVLALIGWGCWPSRSRGLAAGQLVLRRLGEASLVVCGMLLLSPMSSKAHFGVLLLPVAFCLGHCFFGKRSRFVMLCMLVMLGTSLTSKGIVGRDLGREILAHGSVCVGTLAAMLATLRLLSGSRPGRPTSESQ